MWKHVIKTSFSIAIFKGISSVRSPVSRPFPFAARLPWTQPIGWFLSFIFRFHLFVHHFLLCISFCCAIDCPAFTRGRIIGNQIIYGNGLLTCCSSLERRNQKETFVYKWHPVTKLDDLSIQLYWETIKRNWCENVQPYFGTVWERKFSPVVARTVCQWKLSVHDLELKTCRVSIIVSSIQASLFSINFQDFCL